MPTSPRPGLSHEGSDRRHLRRVRKGTRSCWECKRRKIRCIFSSENKDTCNWCHSHGSSCVSQRFPDNSQGLAETQTLQERMVRVEALLQRLLERVEGGEAVEVRSSGHPVTNTVIGDHTGVDVVDPTSASLVTPSHSSQVAVVSTLQSAWSASSDPSISSPSVDFMGSSPKTFPKVERVSSLLMALMPSRQAIEVLDEESSPWINQLLRALPSFQQPGGFSLMQAMPSELPSLSHPTTIARALMCVVVCLQQLPRSFEFAKLGPLTCPVGELVESLTTTVSALVTSDDELVAIPAGIECLFLQSIFFINSGKPRRAWLSNRRAMAIAQLMGLHTQSTDIAGHVNAMAGGWSHINHSDRYLALILGCPYGAADKEISAPLMMGSDQEQNQQDNAYLVELDRIAARIIDKDCSSASSTFVATQSIDNMLETLAQSMPLAWWQNTTTTEDMDAETLANLYSRLNIQLWHHQLSLTLHMPFIFNSTTHLRKYEYNRFSCLNAARGLINTYLPIRRAFGMFLCCITNFQAFTAAVILLYNLSLPSPAFEQENLAEQKSADWALIAEVIEMLDASKERFGDGVAAQATNVLNVLQEAIRNPEDRGCRTVNFTIPYLGNISITRRPHVHETATAFPIMDLRLDGSMMFEGVGDVDISQPNLLLNADELLQHWLTEELNWPT